MCLRLLTVLKSDFLMGVSAIALGLLGNKLTISEYISDYIQITI